MIRDRSQELGTFHARHIAEPIGARSTDANEHHSELADEEVVRLARDARNAAKFEALWQGDISGYASHSEADQALVSLLAFYTQDENQLDSLYRQSALCREKWLKRSDYRRSTIEKALSNLADTYTPSDDGARMVVGNGHASLPSPSPSLYKDEGRGRKLEAVRFSDMAMPGPRRYLLKDLVLAAYVTLLHGDGGDCDNRSRLKELRPGMLRCLDLARPNGAHRAYRSSSGGRGGPTGNVPRCG